MGWSCAGRTAGNSSSAVMWLTWPAQGQGDGSEGRGGGGRGEMGGKGRGWTPGQLAGGCAALMVLVASILMVAMLFWLW